MVLLQIMKIEKKEVPLPCLTHWCCSSTWYLHRIVFVIRARPTTLTANLCLLLSN
jgi:hypothetical protein